MFENITVPFETGTSVKLVLEKLNELGKENWEVAGILKNSSDEVIFFLKRRIEEKIGID